MRNFILACVASLMIVSPSVSNTQENTDKVQISCLADNAYFEAGNQSLDGKIAVSNVVMNRVKHRKFPKTPCAVVQEKTSGICQFSWNCSGVKSRKKHPRQYQESVLAASEVYYNRVSDNTGGALFFNTPARKPYKNVTVKIGDHVFYRG